VEAMQRLIVTEPWEQFPPSDEDNIRLQLYDRMEKLYKSDHAEIFERAAAFVITTNPHLGLYISVNMCSLIANKQADFLFGEDLQFKSPSGNTESEDAMLAIIDRSRMAIELRTGEINSACMGGTVLKVRYSTGENGEERGAYIESMPVSYFFPQLDAKNARHIEAAAMAYVSEEKDEQGTTVKYLYKEIHQPGSVTSEVWRMNGGKIVEQVGDSVTESTGYDGLLLFYVPNNRFGGDFWGMSDFKAIEGLQNEINFAISQLGLSMNKYSEPLMVVPTGSMKPLKEIEQQTRMPFHPLEYTTRILRAAWSKLNPNTKVFPVDGKVIEGDAADLQYLPRYEQPNADFASRLSQIDRLQRLIMAVSETNASALGLEETNLPESGRALRIRMSGPMAKIKRKMQFWHPVLVEAMYAALVLEHNNGMGPEPEKPGIVWPDGLPEDEREQVEIATMMKSGGLASQRTAVAKAQQIEGDALDVELEEIEGEIEKQREATMIDSSEFFPDEGDDAGTRQEVSLNGAQIASMVEIVTQVAVGMIPRDSGVNMLTTAFPISDKQAEEIMGSVGRDFKPAAQSADNFASTGRNQSVSANDNTRDEPTDVDSAGE
jgi:hypothetical protein